jgi:hypothetical protein
MGGEPFARHTDVALWLAPATPLPRDNALTRNVITVASAAAALCSCSVCAPPPPPRSPGDVVCILASYSALSPSLPHQIHLITSRRCDPPAPLTTRSSGESACSATHVNTCVRDMIVRAVACPRCGRDEWIVEGVRVCARAERAVHGSTCAGLANLSHHLPRSHP